MNRYEVIKEDVTNAYILDKSENKIVALCTTKRPDLGFERLENLVRQANKSEMPETDKQKAIQFLKENIRGMAIALSNNNIKMSISAGFLKREDIKSYIDFTYEKIDIYQKIIDTLESA